MAFGHFVEPHACVASQRAHYLERGRGREVARPEAPQGRGGGGDDRRQCGKEWARTTWPKKSTTAKVGVGEGNFLRPLFRRKLPTAPV